MIDLNKKYRTRCGYEVKLDGIIDPYNGIFGEYLNTDNEFGQWIKCYWYNEDGRYDSDNESELDLIEVKDQAIDLNKEYKTRNGREVVILDVMESNNGSRNVFGRYLYDDTWYIVSWHADGTYLHGVINHDMDLVETTPYADLKIDDKVFYYANGIKVYGHYAGLNDLGQPCVWVRGRTSFTVMSTEVGQLNPFHTKDAVPSVTKYID